MWPFKQRNDSPEGPKLTFKDLGAPFPLFEAREDFNHHPPDGQGENLFRLVVKDVVPGLWEDDLHDVTGIYVFRCPECSRLKAHWDLA